jgi:hypothetical protein
MLKSTPKCPKLILEVLKVNIFRFNANGPDLGLQSNVKKVICTAEKKPKIDLWEIAGCAQIQEIEKPV